MPADTYSLVLTRRQLLLVLKAVKAACELWEAISSVDNEEIETLLRTVTEVEAD